jgi:V8-like Glu-specific endopeptidase
VAGAATIRAVSVHPRAEKGPIVYRITLAAVCAAITLASLTTAAQAAAPVAAGAANHATAAEMDAYWTPQRLANAKPMPQPAVSSETKSAQLPDGAPKYVPATTPAAGVIRPAASVWTTVGRLVFTVPGKGDYICTANVVSSANHDVISTARHCVVDVSTWAVYSNFRFAPAYNRGNAPYGWWNWRRAGWRVDDTSAGGDNAFIVLSTGGNNGGHVQDAVGSSGIGFNFSTNAYAHGIGIPGATDYAVWCAGQPYDGPAGGVQIPNCNGLSGGASGGSFIVNYQGDGSATQTASFFGSWGDSYFAYYRDAAYQVYNGAQHS